jgi:hypothetical protein
MSTEEGELQCDEPGVCKWPLLGYIAFDMLHWSFLLLDVIEFDNGFSYIRSKKIWYAISVGSASLVSQTSSDLDKI